jgi:uncharacterized membrane protein YcaP (DUF421 family)
MELHHIAIRAIFVYLVLLGLIRLSGKRTVAEATAFSFVLACILDEGRPHRRGMRGERMNEKGLACEIRHHGLEEEDWAEVEAAHVEVSGDVSVLRAAWARPAQRRDAAAVRKARTP